VYISSVRIQNFRSFQDTTVEFNDGMNVVIGHNNSGKTNLLRALGLIFDREGSRKLAIDDFNKHLNVEKYFEAAPSAAGEKELKEKVPPTITVSVTITESVEPTGDGPDDTNVIFDWFTDAAGKPYKARLTYRFFLPRGAETDRYEAAVKKLIEQGKCSAEDYWGLLQRRFIHKYVARIYGGDPKLQNRADPEQLKKFDFQFLDAIRDVERNLFTGRNTVLRDVLRHYLDHSVKMDDSLTEDGRAAALEEASNAFENDSSRLLKKLKDRIELGPMREYANSVGAKYAGVPDLVGEATQDELLFALKLIVRSSGMEIPITRNGLGYNNLLYISTLLSKMQMSTREHVSLDDVKVFPMLLIEEPEAHLHPSMQFRFLRFLNDNLRKQKQARQVFVTTHSTHITAAVDLDEIICLGVDDEGRQYVSYPGRVFDSGKAEDEKSKGYVRRFLDATKSDLLFARSVILVEGTAEQILVPTMARYVGKPVEDSHVSVVSVGGRCFSHFLKLFDYDPANECKRHALRKRVAVLIDADPTKKEKVKNARWKKCYPYECDQSSSEFDYQPISTTASDLQTRFDGHPYVGVFFVRNGKGKTFEYDLANANPECTLLLTDQVSNGGAKPSLADETLRSLLGSSPWNEEAKKRAAAATAFLEAIESKRDGGKGAHALALDHNLRENLAKREKKDKDYEEFEVPEHIRQAISHVRDGEDDERDPIRRTR